ncbi:MAG: hypothetical protein ACRC8G_09990, partial [Plesiomonas shigelloides]
SIWLMRALWAIGTDTASVYLAVHPMLAGRSIAEQAVQRELTNSDNARSPEVDASGHCRD